MSEREIPSHQRDSEPDQRGGRAYIIWPLAFIALAVGCAAVAQAWGGPFARHGDARHAGFHTGHHACAAGAEGCQSGIDVERAKERVAFGVAWGLRRLDSNEQQEQQIQAIAAAVVEDLIQMHEAHPRPHEQLQALISAESIDRAAVESMRQQHVALFDLASARIAGAAADALEVLTPEQRAKLIDEFQRHHH